MLESSDSYVEIGKQLAAKRKDMDLSLNKVATTLKIRIAYLKAIEDGDLDKMPPGMYAIGYIRNYAKFLGVKLPASPVNEADLESVGNATIATRNLKANKYVPDKPLIAISLIVIIIVNLIYWLIYK